jgi:hypothetical protein
VASGGVLGLDRAQHLLPVDAVTRVDDRVHIEPSHEQVHRCGEYVSQPRQSPTCEEVYRHYGYSPFWAANHVRTYFLRLP